METYILSFETMTWTFVKNPFEEAASPVSDICNEYCFEENQ